MKSIVNVFLLLVLCAGISQAQWTYKGVFPPGDTLASNGVHGLAVDPAGKVWVVNYYAITRDSILIPSDSSKKVGTAHNGRWTSVRALRVYNPNGTQASFSPIFTVTAGSRKDTLGGATNVATAVPGIPKWGANSGRGLRAGYDGNIYAAYWWSVYKINYKTGAGMAIRDYPTYVNGLAGPAVDSAGNVFTTNVFGGFPVQMTSADFAAEVANVTDATPGFNRTLGCSKDGKDVYVTSYTAKCAIRFHSDLPGLVPFAVVDTIFKGMCIESITWQPAKAARPLRLWVSAGSFNDLPNTFAGATTSWTTCMWYGFNATNLATPVDSIMMPWFGTPNNSNERPRAIAFSPTGDTVYVGEFSAGACNWFVKGGVGVERESNLVPENFMLSQNYPNPFNPSTKINFSLTTRSTIMLKVYDALGKEVAELASGDFAAGSYSVDFTASKIASGMYFYRLTSSAGFSVTKKMVLMK